MKRYASCTLCDEEVFDCRARWPEDSPLEGQIRIRMGPHANASRVTFALLDGSTTDMTFCEGCVEEITPNIVKIWDKVIERHVVSVDPEARLALGYPLHTDIQHEMAEREAMQLLHNRPLGVLAVQPWNEVVTWPG